MNCQTFKKSIADLLEAHPDHTLKSDMLQHAEVCPECARELAESQALLSALTPSQKVVASTNLKERIMNKVSQVDSLPAEQRRTRKPLTVTRFTLAAVILAAVFFGYSYMQPASATKVLVQAVEAAESIRSMHINARMRTVPVDNFDLIMPKMDFVRVDIWTTADQPNKWRVEKPGRVVVMDGNTTVGIIRPESESPLAFEANHPSTGFIGWLSPLTDVQSLLMKEEETAREQGSKVIIEEKNDMSGAPKTIVTVQAKAQGNYSESNYARNKSILESDNIRIYEFDARTHRLDSMKVYIDMGKEKVLVFEITGVEYDTHLDASLFDPAVPDNATWYETPDQIVGTRNNSSMTPKQAAEAIFRACAESDWEALRGFAGTLSDKSDIREYLGGLQIISIGKPFKSGLYAGWYIPYEIKLKSGEVKKFNLAIRNDNPKHQWMLDGGI